MSNEFTLCTRCAVNNNPGRTVCWQCGNKLPLAVGIDGRHVAVDTTPSGNLKSVDIEALLNQADTIDVETDTKKFRREQQEMAAKAQSEASSEASAKPESLSLKARLLRLVGRRTPHPQA